MNSDKSEFTKNAIVSGNMDLVFNCKLTGYLACIRIGDKIFCEIAVSSRRTKISDPVYYDFYDFCYWGRQNTLRMIVEEFSSQKTEEELEYLATKYTLTQLRDMSSNTDTTPDKVVVSIKEVKNTGELIYIIDNVVYSEHFPLEWALTPNKDESGYTYGPGTSNTHCLNCCISGSLCGVFIGYCGNCSYYGYRLSRGHGFRVDGQEMRWHDDSENIPKSAMETYLYNVDLQKIGYTESDVCLSAGRAPTGPDICDDQSDLDPLREDEVDEIRVSSGGIRASKRHPRRAYGIPSIIGTEIVNVGVTDTMTPDFIRHKIEEFFAANAIEVTDNNYSFPIGRRENWDHYRIEKHPNYWYAWNAILKSESDGGEDVKIRMRLYLSNPLRAKKQQEDGEIKEPANMILECQNQKGRNLVYHSMIKSLGDWILGQTDSTDIILPELLFSSLEELENEYKRDDDEGMWMIITLCIILCCMIRLLCLV